MKCIYCKNEGEGSFCSSCGKEYNNTFSNKKFLELFQYVFENKDNYLSKEFNNLVKLNPSPFGLLSADDFYKSLQVIGYLLRTVEEMFLMGVIKSNKNITEILKNNNEMLDEKLDRVANYIDINMRPGSLLSFSTLNEELFLVEKSKMVFILDEYVYHNIEENVKIINNGQAAVVFKKDKKEDEETFSELLFRNAIYGYCYKIAEEQLKLANLK
jgi:hypothetical protein